MSFRRHLFPSSTRPLMSLTRWSTSHFLSSSPLTATPDHPCGLIILNTPVARHVLDRLWTACHWRSCADGGANRLYDILTEEERSKYLPDLIKGDLDSIRPNVKDYYASKGVSIVEDRDLYATDLMKCIAALKSHEESTSTAYNLIIMGGLSGRLDQTVHTMTQLHKLRKERPRTFVVTEDNVAWVLDSGQHIIGVDRVICGPTCGLLPVGIESTILSTRGLRWNLDKTLSSFSGLVSTSNWVDKDEVYVETTEPIWWCLEMRK